MKSTPLLPPKLKTALATACAVACCGLTLRSARADTSATLDVDLSRPGPAIPPNFGGLMTEEINHAYDGGLFAELIQNRTFQDPGKGKDGLPIHWSIIGAGKVETDKADPVNAALPVSLRLDLSGGTAGVANDGYWGIPIRPDTTYTASFYAKGSGGFSGVVTASLLTDEGSATVADVKTKPLTGTWQKYTITLKTAHDAPTTAEARLVLSATGSGSVSFSLVSLFPPTFQDTPGGLRPDLMTLMAGLRPAFIRLPGGNYVEGNTFPTRFDWKRMIGPADQRPGHMGCWSYRSSDGFGLPQYLLWCKQLNAEPILAVFAGYTLNHDHVDAGSPEMAQYTEEALEEIEYVSGPADSEWGKRRAADGFPEPFPLHYVEIGNEDWFDRSPSYDGRFTQIAKAIRERYPHLKLMATAPVKSFKPDLYDDHLYASARQMLAGFNQYNPRTDATPIKFGGGRWNGRQPDTVKTFLGEWATQEGRPTPDLNAALADAAYLMGLERNADAVPLECYAPLLVNVNPADPAKGYPKGWQWPTNLIGYDALHSFGSPSYYAQAMLAQNRGDTVLPARFEVAPVASASASMPPHGLIGVGTYHTQAEYTDISVTAPDGRALLKADLSKDTKGWQFTGDKWTLADGAIKPSGDNSETWGITGDPNWTDYTIHVRARKLGGKEGFLVLWHATDSENFNWWNVGGWDNTATRFQASEAGGRETFGPSADFKVEADRWYDLRLEVTGNHVRGFVDSKLVSEATEESHSAPTAMATVASASYIQADHSVVVKVVNAGGEPVDAAIRLHGAGRVEPRGKAIVLTGEPKAVNTIDQPTNVAPKESDIDASASFHRTFPPHSLTLLRLTASPQ